MGFINLFVTNPARISISNKQMLVENVDGKNTFPIEDINSIIIENNKCLISSYALSYFAENAVVMYTCDSSHMPNGVMLPLNRNYKQLKVISSQIELSAVIKKHLWQEIIKMKIYNQAECIRLASGEIIEELYLISKTIASNDNKNMEAVAASKYFKLLFGNNFNRRKEQFINDMLNYGYAIIRGQIARTLICYGFETCLGLHHKNQLNNFNLVDDIIEPFRPVVDLIVNSIVNNTQFNELDKKVKGLLFNIVNQNVLINGNKVAISYAIEIVVQTLLKSYKENKNNLVLPKILPIEMHSYE